jgi:hypothetical protein
LENVKEQSVSAILQEGVDFTVTVTNPGLWHRIGVLKKERKFIVHPLCLGSLLRISKLLVSLEDKPLDLSGNVLSVASNGIIQYSRIFAEISAIAVTNTDKEPSERLIQFFIDNLTPKELFQLLQLVIKQMEVSDFLLCIVSAKGLNLLKEKNAGAMEDQTTGALSEAS